MFRTFSKKETKTSPKQIASNGSGEDKQETPNFCVNMNITNVNVNLNCLGVNTQQPMENSGPSDFMQLDNFISQMDSMAQFCPNQFDNSGSGFGSF